VLPLLPFHVCLRAVDCAGTRSTSTTILSSAIVDGRPIVSFRCTAPSEPVKVHDDDDDEEEEEEEEEEQEVAVELYSVPLAVFHLALLT